jgi:pimeloyl-ACP methyl ester carboxylesterase
LVIRYVEWLIGHRFETIAPVNTVRHIRCPVVLVHGSHDQAVPIGDARRIHGNRGPARVRLIEIPGAGHDSVDRIERHVGELIAFLDDVCSVRTCPPAEGVPQAARQPP